MSKDYTNSFILNSLKLPVMRSLDEFAYNIGLSKTMLYLLSKNSDDYYKSFTVPKKNNEFRTISSPTYSMKHAQRWILEEILGKITVTNEAMAFKKGIGIGIKKNAEHHKYNLYLLQLDLKDFFINIKRKRVYYIFKNLGYNSFISNVLSNLCLYNGHIPQGGVTSPYLSNLICNKLDKRLIGLCAKRDIVYTRYADDLTFSCNNKLTLKKIKKIIEMIIQDEGFEINIQKTRLLSPASHKIVTGLTINNEEVKASKKLKKKVRAMIHHSILTENYGDNKKIIGYISFINSIEPGYKNRIKSYIQKLTKKDYTKYKSVVDSFNSNKLYKDIEDMIYDPHHEEIVRYHDEDYDENYHEDFVYFKNYQESFKSLNLKRAFLAEKAIKK